MGITIEIKKDKVIVYDKINRIYFSPLASGKGCNFTAFKHAIDRNNTEKPMSYNDIMRIARIYKVGSAGYLW